MGTYKYLHCITEFSGESRCRLKSSGAMKHLLKQMVIHSMRSTFLEIDECIQQHSTNKGVNFNSVVSALEMLKNHF